MKYRVKCVSCGYEGDFELDFTPVGCLKCGGRVVAEVVRSKQRIAAEEKLGEMVEIVALVTEARKAYQDVLVEHEKRLPDLREYYRKGCLTKEEYEKCNLNKEDTPRGVVEAMVNIRKEEKSKRVEDGKAG